MLRLSLVILLAFAGMAEATPEDELIARAREAMERGRFDDAEQIARDAVAASPGSSEALRVAGLAAFRAGKWKRAREWFEKELAIAHVEDTVVRFNLAGAEFKLADFDAAERDYLAAAADEKLGALALLNAGLAADGRGDWTRARQHFLRARDRASQRGQGSLSDRAGELYQQTMETARDGAWKLAREGTTALREGRAAEAVDLLRRAIAQSALSELPEGDRADFEYSYGHALLAVGRAHEAIEALRSAIHRVPADAEYHYVLAVALHKSGDDRAAASELRAALDSGLAGGDAAEARAFIAGGSSPGILSGRSASEARLTVDELLGVGYDSNYPGGREILFMKGAAMAGQSLGSGDLVAEVEPRLRLSGRLGNGLFAGDRLSALIYFSSAADNFSLLENELYLEGQVSPRPWLLLSAAVEGYLQTTGLRSFGLYQAGARTWLKATFYEGAAFATRLRYELTAMDSLQPLYDYLGGTHHDAQVAEILYSDSWRLTASYTLHAELVGVQQSPSAQILGPTAESALQATTHSPMALYAIPFSYLGHDVGLDIDGEAAGFRLAASLHYERRAYLDDVIITPAPRTGYVKRRADDRVTLELAIKHDLFWKLSARAALYTLFSGSNINDTNPLTPFDYDDRNYSRVMFTADLQRPF